MWTSWLTWGVVFIVGIFATLFGTFVDFYATWGNVTALVGYFIVPFVSVWWLIGAFESNSTSNAFWLEWISYVLVAGSSEAAAYRWSNCLSDWAEM